MLKVAEGTRLLLRVQGDEGIPNVKGPDGYWWNDVQLDLPEPLGGEARVSIVDNKHKKTYSFVVRRLVSRP